jgi:hypothetical protein
MISASDFIDGQVMVLRVIVADLKFDTIREVTQPRGSSSEITDRRVVSSWLPIHRLII